MSFIYKQRCQKCKREFQVPEPDWSKPKLHRCPHCKGSPSTP